MDTLLVISIIGAAVDVLPWLLYDITETGQKSMIRVIRIRTLVEDKNTGNFDEVSYIEGCEAIFKAREYFEKEPENISDYKLKLKEARTLPKNTEEQTKARTEAIAQAKINLANAQEHNEEIEIARFVMHELNRFTNDFGKKQLELCKLIVGLGPQHFYECWEKAQELAYALPITDDKEERTWRKQEIRNAKSLSKSLRLAEEKYAEGIIPFDNQEFEDAYNMPDETKEQAKLRRKAMRDANKKKNLYASVAAPYLDAKRTLDLYEGYSNLDKLTEDYNNVVENRKIRLDAERAEQEKIKAERDLDIRRKQAQKKIKTKK